MVELLPLHHNSEKEVIAWAKKIAQQMTDDKKRDADLVLISLSQSKLFEKEAPFITLVTFFFWISFTLSI